MKLHSGMQRDEISDLFKGIVAGGVATGVLSLVMLMIGATGFEPQLELPRLLLIVVDEPADRALGWILHIAIGSVLLGGLFAYIQPRLHANSHTKKGILYALIAWLIMMLVFLPAAGAGYFGFQLSLLAPLVMLGLHVVYGTVLGWTYGKLSPTHSPFTHHHPA